jgi:integrase
VSKGIHKLPNGHFRVRVAFGDRCRGGVQKERTFPAGTGLKEMRKWQEDTKADLRRSAMRPAKGTLEADAPRYLERVQNRIAFPKKRKPQIEAWFPNFGKRGRHTIKQPEVRQQVKDWLAAGVSASEIRKRMTALSQLYTELDGDEAYNPVKGIKRPKEPEPQPDFRPPDVILAVLDALAWRAAKRNRGWKTLARALVLTYTGVRPSQMMRIDPASHIFLDDELPKVFVPAGKGGKSHFKPLTPGGVAAFRLFILSGAKGKFSTSAFYKSWMLAAKQAGVEKFNPYKLRHSYATLLRRGGLDVADVQELLGHKNPKTTQRYAAVIPAKLASAAGAFQKLWRPSPANVPANGTSPRSSPRILKVSDGS